MKKEFDFLKEFGEIDGNLVENAGREWKRKKYGVFQLYSRKIAGVAMLAMIGIAAISNSRVQAAVREFTTKIGEALGFAKDLSSYTEIIDQTQTKDGISLTLKEVILDDRVLAVCVHTDFGKQEGSLWINDEKTLINGQHNMTYESMESAAGGDGDVFKPKRDAVLVQIYEDQILPNDDVKVHLVLEGAKWIDHGDELVLPDNFEEQATEFVYDFVVTPGELRKKTRKQELNLTVGESGEEKKNLTLKELSMNDLYSRIIAEGVTWDDDWPNQYELKLKGTDSLGNPVSLEGGRFLSENEMLFATDFLGDYEAGEVIEDAEFQLSVPDKDCDYLDLQLYERKMIWDGAEEMEGILDEEEGIYEQELVEAWEAYSEDENYGWEPVGEPFRITITHTGGMKDDEN